MKNKFIIFFLYLFIFKYNLNCQPVLTIDEAVGIALRNNYDIRVAKNEAEIAAISNSWALAGRLPTVNATTGYNYSLTNLQQELSNGTVTKRNGTVSNNLNGTAGASWRIFNGFRVLAAKRRLEEQERIGQLSLKQRSNETIYAVVTQYYNIVQLQQQAKAIRETIGLFEERMKLSKARFEIGTAAKNDYLQAEIDLNTQRNDSINISNSIKTAKTSLNNILAREPVIEFNIIDSINITDMPNQQDVLKNIDTLNPQLLVSRSNEIVIQQQRREINSQRYPSLSINAGVGFNKSNNNAGFTLLNQTLGPTAGVTLSVPLFQGGVIRQQLKINDIQLKSQQVETESIRNNLKATILNAYTTYENAKQQVALETANLNLIKENNYIAMERFRKASITIVELRQAQMNLIESQSRTINALYNMRLATAILQMLMATLAD